MSSHNLPIKIIAQWKRLKHRTKWFISKTCINCLTFDVRTIWNFMYGHHQTLYTIRGDQQSELQSENNTFDLYLETWRNLTDEVTVHTELYALTSRVTLCMMSPVQKSMNRLEKSEIDEQSTRLPWMSGPPLHLQRWPSWVTKYLQRVYRTGGQSQRVITGPWESCARFMLVPHLWLWLRAHSFFVF